MIYIANLIEGLRQLADLEFQRHAWLAADGPVVSSFSEAVSQTFDDTGLADAIDADRCPQELDAESFDALKLLDSAVSDVDDSLDIEALLAAPKMSEVRTLASSALTLLERKHKTSVQHQ